MPRCWECETEVDRTVRVDLRPTAGADVQVWLCQACGERCYLPLVAARVDGPVQPDPGLDDFRRAVG